MIEKQNVDTKETRRGARLTLHVVPDEFSFTGQDSSHVTRLFIHSRLVRRRILAASLSILHS